MVHGLDSSILVRLVSGKPATLYQEASHYVQESFQTGDRLRVTPLVISETYFACQDFYGITKADIIQSLRQIFSEPVFLLEPYIREIVELPNLHRLKPGFIDRLIHQEYHVQGASLVTFEKAAAKLPGTTVLKASR